MKKIIIYTGLLLGLFLTSCSTSGRLPNVDDNAKTEDKFKDDTVIAISEPQSLADFLVHAPGVYVDQGFGGTVATIRGRIPLYVVDGIPIGNSYMEANNVVSVHDIDYVEVLKDPTETALYGRRGSNGVIVINTRRN